MEGKGMYQIFQLVLMLVILSESFITVQCVTTKTTDSLNISVSASLNQSVAKDTPVVTNTFTTTTTENTTTETNSSEETTASMASSPNNTTASTSTIPSSVIRTATGSMSQNSTQEREAKETPELIIIIAVTAVAGILVGVVATVIIFKCRRKKGGNRTTRQLSLKRNLSYNVNSISNVEDNPTKPIPEYIQILPDIDNSSYTDVKLQNGSVKIVADRVNTNRKTITEDDYDIVDEDEKQNKSVKIVPGDINISASPKTSTEDDYDIVDEVENSKPDHLQLPHEDYSHINHGNRKISDTSYSHLGIDTANVLKCTDNSGTTRISYLDTHETGLSENETRWEEDYSNLNAKIDNVLQAMDKTIATYTDTTEDDYSNLNAKNDTALQPMDKTIPTYEYDNTRENKNKTDNVDTYSEYDEDELYNHLGSLKVKNGFGNVKLNLGNQQRNRSRSLPAQDIEPQVKIFCDDADTYNHIEDHMPKREPTYYNWKPIRYAKSRSLPEQENLEHTKHMENDIDTYSHINLMKKSNVPKRKIGIAANNPDHAGLELKDPTTTAVDNIPNDSRKNTENFGSSSCSSAIKPDLRASNISKSSVFTIQENDNMDEQPHSYFILEPTTTTF